jgi:V8-like Glu-specific endopeptidase
MSVKGEATLSIFAVMWVIGTIQTASAQSKPPDYQALLKKSKAAIVQIEATGQPNNPDKSTGTGFGVSPGGLIVTAAHVVTYHETKQPNATGPQVELPNGIVAKYLPTITIKTSDGRTLNVTPVRTLALQNMVQDYVVLKGTNLNLPSSLSIGFSSDVHEGDDLTVWGFPLGLANPTLIKGTVASAGQDAIQLEANKPALQIRYIVFQGPNNKGMSGGPVIDNKTGNVVGIVNNRLAGIGEELAKTRQQINAAKGSGSVQIQGVDPNANILALIDVLDKYLMTGMGVALAIDPIKTDLPAR